MNVLTPDIMSYAQPLTYPLLLSIRTVIVPSYLLSGKRLFAGRHVDALFFFSSLQFLVAFPTFVRDTSVRISVSIQTGVTYMLPCMYTLWLLSRWGNEKIVPKEDAQKIF